MSSFESWQPGVGDSCVLGLPRWTLASVGQQAGRRVSRAESQPSGWKVSCQNLMSEISGEVVRWVTPGDMAGGDGAGGWEGIEGQAGKRNRFGMVVKLISLRWLSTKLIKCPTVKSGDFILLAVKCRPPDGFLMVIANYCWSTC